MKRGMEADEGSAKRSTHSSPCLLDGEAIIGDYKSILQALKTCLWNCLAKFPTQAEANNRSLLVAMGHGGSNSWLALVIAQAIREYKKLH